MPISTDGSGTTKDRQRTFSSEMSTYKLLFSNYVWRKLIVVDVYGRRKEMFYLTTHSTHFIYGYMVKDHSDSEKGNPLPPHRLLLLINSKGSFICTIPQTG